jgi:hypothetical protein
MMTYRSELFTPYTVIAFAKIVATFVFWQRGIDTPDRPKQTEHTLIAAANIQFNLKIGMTGFELSSRNYSTTFRHPSPFFRSI